jgi:hypothetical protein
LPLLLYSAPVWIRAMEKGKYKNKIIRVQRLINIKMAKAYRTVSNDALCVITGMTPINIKIEEAAELYHQISGYMKDNEQFDNKKEARFWQHSAEAIIRPSEGIGEDSPLHIYTDGSKTERGLGSGTTVYSSDQKVRCLQFKLHTKCTKDKAEHLAITKVLEFIDVFLNDKTTTEIYTDSRTTLDMLQNGKIHKI